MAVGQPGQGIVLRQARGIALALPGRRNVVAVAAISGEFPRLVRLGTARDRPPHLFPVDRGADLKVGKGLSRRKQQRQGPLDRIILIAFQDEHALQRLTDDRAALLPQQLCHAIRDVGNPPFAVAGPEPAEARCFIVLQQQDSFVQFLSGQVNARRCLLACPGTPQIPNAFKDRTNRHFQKRPLTSEN